jgi:hypothetical protein
MIFLGATLSLFIGIFWFITWSQDLTITIDNCFNKAILCKKNLFKQSSSLDVSLSDIKGIQLLSYTIKAGQSGWHNTDIDVTVHEVNLVLNSYSNQRQFLYNHRNLTIAIDAAKRIAIILGTTIIDHSDQKDIRE